MENLNLELKNEEVRLKKEQKHKYKYKDIARELNFTEIPPKGKSILSG